MTITVSVRVRPPAKRKKSDSQHVKVSQDGRTLFVSRNPQLIQQEERRPSSLVAKTFVFDEAFSPQNNQSDIYSTLIQENVKKVFEGHQFSVFLIGQSGSGKTHTLSGHNHHAVGDDRGIIPRTMEQLIENCNQIRTRENNYAIHVSLFRVDNEIIHDIMGNRSMLKLHDTPDHTGSSPIGAFKTTVTDIHQVADLLHKFDRAQHKTLTSHLVWSVTVERTHLDETSARGYGTWRSSTISHMHFIRMASLERSKHPNEKYPPNARRNLAKSFDGLCTVLHFLNRGDSYIPYRNTKLTHLVKDCISPTSDTILIHTISPCLKDMNETIHTLQYAQKIYEICRECDSGSRKHRNKSKKSINAACRSRRDLHNTRRRHRTHSHNQSHDSEQSLIFTSSYPRSHKSHICFSPTSTILNESQKLYDEPSEDSMSRRTSFNRTSKVVQKDKRKMRGVSNSDGEVSIYCDGKNGKVNEKKLSMNEMLKMVQKVRRKMRGISNSDVEIEYLHKLESGLLNLIKDNNRLKSTKSQFNDHNSSWLNSEIENLQQENLKHKNKITLLQNEIDTINAERENQARIQREALEIQRERLAHEARSREQIYNELTRVTEELSKARQDCVRYQGEAGMWKERHRQVQSLNEVKNLIDYNTTGILTGAVVSEPACMNNNPSKLINDNGTNNHNICNAADFSFCGDKAPSPVSSLTQAERNVMKEIYMSSIGTVTDSPYLIETESSPFLTKTHLKKWESLTEEKDISVFNSNLSNVNHLVGDMPFASLSSLASPPEAEINCLQANFLQNSPSNLDNIASSINNLTQSNPPNGPSIAENIQKSVMNAQNALNYEFHTKPNSSNVSPKEFRFNTIEILKQMDLKNKNTTKDLDYQIASLDADFMKIQSEISSYCSPVGTSHEKTTITTRPNLYDLGCVLSAVPGSD